MLHSRQSRSQNLGLLTFPGHERLHRQLHARTREPLTALFQLEPTEHEPPNPHTFGSLLLHIELPNPYALYRGTERVVPLIHTRRFQVILKAVVLGDHLVHSFARYPTSCTLSANPS